MFQFNRPLPRELRTQRLLLRQWCESDVEPMAQMYAQPEFTEHNPALTLEQTRTQIARFMERWASDGIMQWAAEDLASGTLIGRAGLLRQRDWPIGSPPVEVGWTLHRDWWGRGLATEGGAAAVQCWREHLVSESQLISITVPDNQRSRAVMARLGMTLRGETFWRGREVVWYALDRDA
ncbi:MAG: GNAT family N-acetyltransferase [Gemmatimonadota bacterium]|nr:GNAT family N-acetyltransferase [Gemmatimonadota bacterium]